MTVQRKGEGNKESLIREAKSQEREIVKDVIVQEKEAQIKALMDNLERAKFLISYLEQENKQLSHKQVLMELELLKTKRQSDKDGHVTLAPIEQEIEQDRETWLERVKLHLERLIFKANRDKKMLRHMAYHYMARNKICNMRIRKLKARLRRALEGKKE